MVSAVQMPMATHNSRRAIPKPKRRKKFTYFIGWDHQRIPCLTIESVAQKKRRAKELRGKRGVRKADKIAS
jgi:hypothetical protein